MIQDRVVSIVIPVYNDATGISQTLDSIHQLDLLGIDAQVLVIDNGSTDKTQQVINEYVQANEHIHLLVEDEVQGSYAARNKGIRHADGGVLVFLDADETVESNWLKTAIKAMREQNVDYLGCNVEITLSEHTLVGEYNVQTGFPVKQYLENDYYAPTCALLVRHEVFENVGLFDARLTSGGDREFGERVKKAGYSQGYAENAVVYHPARTNFRPLAKKNYRVGQGFCQKQRYYPQRFGKPGIPPRPNGSRSNNASDDTLSFTTRLIFRLLSFLMLACRGLGYYHEFFFGKIRDDIPSPAN